MDTRVRNILEHMLDDSMDVLEFSGEIGNADAFAASRLYRKAIVMSIINIGELAKNLPQEFKSTYNEIPWKKIAGMRDIAAHGYYEMDDGIIWDVAVQSIPELADFLQARLKDAM